MTPGTCPRRLPGGRICGRPPKSEARDRQNEHCYAIVSTCWSGHSWADFVEDVPPDARARDTGPRLPDYDKVCPCGTSFRSVMPFRIYCDRCRQDRSKEMRRRKALRAALIAARGPVLCRACGQPFPAERTWRYCPTCRTGRWCPRCSTRHLNECPLLSSPDQQRRSMAIFKGKLVRSAERVLAPLGRAR